MLNKQAINVNFAQGLDLKSDPYQVQMGKFLSLENSVFDTGGRLTKRNGYGPLLSTVLGGTSSSVSASPSTLSATYLTTFNGNLTALGEALYSYAPNSGGWVNKGDLTPVSLSTLPLVRSSTNQSQGDAVVASNGYVCTAYTDNVNGSAVYKYVVADSVTGQNIIAPITISTSLAPRVFLLGSYFIILYKDSSTGQLYFIAVSTSNPTVATTPDNINTDVVSSSTRLAFDAALAPNNRLYIAYSTATGGQAIKVTYLTNTLAVATPVTFSSEIATMMSVCVDATSPANPIVWVAYYDNAGTTLSALAVALNLATILSPTALTSSGTRLNITAVATGGPGSSICTIITEIQETYSYGSSLPTNRVSRRAITQAGVVDSPLTIARSVGLASKAFLIDDVAYVLTAYSSTYQPSYFLVNVSTGHVIAKLAYSNGGGYLTTGLPNVTVIDGVAYIAYLIKDLIQSTNVTDTSSTSPVYSQLGVNLASFDFFPSNTLSAEIGTNLNLTGGFITAYDGYQTTEQGFFLWPDNVVAATSGTGGTIAAGTYYYVATYEWADNQGNVFRSAASVPTTVTTTGSTSSNTIDVPTLRLTYKTANPVKIVVYRYSVAQQVYYAIQSPSAAPILNDTTVNSITITDTSPDSAIIGNPILYTTGGVLENISPPASDVMTLFNNRLWLVDSEDRNLLWYSKQVIETTPVEMSDLLTLYVAPTTGSQGSTGPITALAPMDDKLVIFKANALGYISGTGPDNTGLNNQYSDFSLINSVVGCDNPKSIVLTPNGLIFQSNKGMWLLDRSLNTQYIGAPVEALTRGALVKSALNIPTTNQVRFTMNTGITLIYDYYYGQWGTFTNVPAISSTIYEQLHTYLDQYGRVFQETPGEYLDGSSPVLMSFRTGWANLAGLQGFQRFYMLYLLGTYKTPFKLNVQLSYNYDSTTVQNIIVTPDPGNVTPDWGDEQLWGSETPYGGTTPVFNPRIFPQIQKCQSFQLTINELYDPSYGVEAGAGLTLSAMNIVAGMKAGYRPRPSSRSFG